MMTASHSFPMRPYRGEDETPTSFASRYAAVNGFPSISAWCTLVGHTAFDFASGNATSLRWLATLDGDDKDAFATAITGRGDRYRVGDQVLRKADLRRLRLRVCPRCVAEDLEVSGYPEHVRPFGRVLWCLAALPTCAKHDVSLVEVDADDANAGMGGIDFTVALRRHLPQIVETARIAPPRSPSSREIYLVSRIGGKPVGTSTLLDALPFYAAVRACQIVGSVACAGPAATMREFGEDGAYHAADRGFDILAAGPEGIEDLMRTMVDQVLADSTARWGIRTMLGQLHDGFAHRNNDAAYDTIRRVVSDFVLRTMPLAPGDLLFGSPIGVRRLHSIRSASETTGIHPKTLRRHLATHGVIPSSMRGIPDDRVTFPAEALRELPDATEQVLDLAKLGRHLDIPRVHLAVIGHSDLLEPVRKPSQDGAARLGFTMEEVERFRERMFSHAVEVSVPPPGTADIVDARKRSCRGLLEILHLVLEDGRLRKFRLAGRHDYGALLLDVDEVKSAVAGDDHGGVPIYKVAKLLGTGDRVAKRLIGDGILAVRVARNAVNRCEQRIVDRQTIDEFRRTYVSLPELANDRGCDRSVVKRELKTSGIGPAFDAKRIGAIFYERCRLPSC